MSLISLRKVFPAGVYVSDVACCDRSTGRNAHRKQVGKTQTAFKACAARGSWWKELILEPMPRFNFLFRKEDGNEKTLNLLLAASSSAVRS